MNIFIHFLRTIFIVQKKNDYFALNDVATLLNPPYMNLYPTREKALAELEVILNRGRAFGGRSPWVM